MLDKILKTFFVVKEQKKKAKCITVVRNTSFFNENEIINKRNTIKSRFEKTCLSSYFENIKGLNLLEREKANSLYNQR